MLSWRAGLLTVAWVAWARAQSGVVSGVALEHQSGAPLARSRIRLDRIDSTGRVQSASAISGRAGQFTFAGLAPGLYVLTAMRDGYAPVTFGQRRPQGSAPPFTLEKDANVFAELRLRKWAVITGRVLDENRVGIRRAVVSAFPVRPPFRAAATAESDDRGVYRLHGLAPGRYRIRSGPFRHDDGMALLPTFTAEARDLRDARIHAARLDAETPDADVTPMSGELITIAGSVSCAPPNPGPVDVVISTETGRRQTRVGCQGGFRFDNLGPGRYELLASTADGRLSAFVERSFEQTAQNAHLELRPSPEVRISFRDESGRAPISLAGTVLLRRVDLAGIAEMREVPLNGSARLPMTPGWWEVAGRLAPPHYLDQATMSWNRGGKPRASAHPDWHEVLIDPFGSNDLYLPVAGKAGSITAQVVSEGKPVPGIPVFLLPIQAETRRRSGGGRIGFTNLTGEVVFDGLAPGDHRLLASYDFDEIDEETAETAQAILVGLTPNGKARIQLTPYVAVE